MLTIVVIWLHILCHFNALLSSLDVFKIKFLTESDSLIEGIFFGLIVIISLLSIILYDKTYIWSYLLMASCVISQCLVFVLWKKSGLISIINILGLLVSIVGVGKRLFITACSKELREMVSNIQDDSHETISEATIAHLPAPVQKWLIKSGAIGKKRIMRMDSVQEYKLKMKEEQTEWFNAIANQTSFSNPPGFFWTLDMKMKGLPVFGRDMFNKGKGFMTIKLLNLLNVVNVGGVEKINEAALQRFLGEAVWVPTVALCNYIKWEHVDDHTSKAIMTIDGVSGEGFFDFDDEGKPTRFRALRYQGVEENAERKWWHAEVLEHKNLGGYLVPSKCQATWKLDKGDWTWASFEIITARYSHYE